MRFLAGLLLMCGSFLAISLHAQEAGDRDHDKPVKTVSKQRLNELTERFRRAVNGKAVVHNRCQARGQTVQIEETTEILEIDGCNLTLRTRKTSISPEGQRELQFTIHTDLADLATPSSIELKSFTECRPQDGDIVKVVSPAEPGKQIRVTRRETSRLADGTKRGNDSEAEILRHDVSLFFSDPVAARKAARALDRAVQSCGGKDWPDEDDLP